MYVSYNLHLCKTFAAFSGPSACEEQGGPEQLFCSLTSNRPERVGYAHRNTDELLMPGNQHGTTVRSLRETRVRSLAGGLGATWALGARRQHIRLRESLSSVPLNREDF